MFYNHDLQLMQLVQQKQYTAAIYYARPHMDKFNNIGKDTVLMAIFHVLNRNKTVSKQHTILCLQLYKKINTGPTLYSQPVVTKLLKRYHLL